MRLESPDMNVFLLTAGRSGSLTFVRACEHITNYSAGHETRAGLLGADRLAYPDRHIEADNRLTWLLGRLDEAFGDRALYIHLKRDPEAVAASFRRRWNKPAMRAYRKGILLDLDPDSDPMAVARDYVTTVERNIELFLRGRPQAMVFELEAAARDFPLFWERIGAEGDRTAAIAEFSVRHHETPQGGAPSDGAPLIRRPLLARLWRSGRTPRRGR
ncbi:hypothetical protein BH23CHL8_BH23CHL8_23560 [soil metagenome]